MNWEIRCGDALTLLREMPEESVQCVVTSPPYWGLRDYGTAAWEGGEAGCDHVASDRKPTDRRASTLGGGVATIAAQDAGAKARMVCPCGARRIDAQLGLEPTPEAYVAKMVEVSRQVRRVLRADGTLWLNLGDSYAGSGKGGNPENSPWSGFVGNSRREASAKAAPPIVPPGLKPKDLVGIPWRVAFALQADGWYLRSDIIWAKPNPMPESVTDRPTKAHEYVFLLTKSARYFFDAEAVREPAEYGRCDGGFRGEGAYTSNRAFENDAPIVGATVSTSKGKCDPTAGRNIRSVWNIATQPFPEAHFATFPEKLVEPCVKAGSRTGDVVLDPFAGSGTVGVVALRLGRSFLGLELSPAYCEMARRRIIGDAELLNSIAEI